MIILGVETSCDETAVAVLEGTGELSPAAIKLRSNIIASQIELHRQFGGVVPEVASRRHVETIIPVIEKALDEAEVSLSDITAVSATHGPGLVGAVLVGLSAAKALALALEVPFIGVNHIEAHKMCIRDSLEDLAVIGQPWYLGPKPGVVAALGERQIALGNTVDARDLVPFYMGKSSAEMAKARCGLSLIHICPSPSSCPS